MSAKVFHSRQPELPGSSYDEVVARARKEFNTIRRITKRQPYVRSKYFRGDKVFMTVFWDHLMQKHLKGRTRRLKFYSAAVDLLRNSTLPAATPIVSKENPGHLLHRKDFMSVFDRKAPK